MYTSTKSIQQVTDVWVEKILVARALGDLRDSVLSPARVLPSISTRYTVEIRFQEVSDSQSGRVPDGGGVLGIFKIV